MKMESTRIRLSDHFTYGKLLRFTLPSIAMMVFSSIYGVVDGYFVSNYAGKTPFAAVNLVMPVLAIMGIVSFMFGTGGTALVAKTCGEGDKDRANRYFSLIVYVAFAVGVVLAILGFILIRPIAARLGADGPLLDSCVRYARIVLFALPLFSMRVLLAEDEKRMAAALVALLKQEKFDVDHMADGASALAALESGVYDIAVLDVMMHPDP